jgi:hypothetical protein
MLPTGFEQAIPASDSSQTLALDRSAAGIGYLWKEEEKVFLAVCFDGCAVVQWKRLTVKIRMLKSILK